MFVLIACKDAILHTINMQIKGALCTNKKKYMQNTCKKYMYMQNVSEIYTQR